MSEGLMGWGDPKDPPSKTLLREKIAFEVASQAHPERYVAFEALEPRAESVIEEELRKLMPFDEGWDFRYAEQLLYGEELTFKQNIGNCVGASHCMLLAAKVAHEILVEGDPEEKLGEARVNSPIPYVPYSYGAGRVYIGGNRISGDGSLCQWQLQASMEHGFLPSDSDGISGSVPQGSASTGRQFGRSKSTLDKFRPQAIQYDLETTVDVSSADQAQTLVVEQKQPLQICSNWGFAFSHYDSKYDLNIYKKSGSWAHSMQVIAVFAKKNNWFVRIRNQWGKSHKDGMTFVVPLELFDRWVRQSNTGSIGELKGRPTDPGFEVV